MQSASRGPSVGVVAGAQCESSARRAGTPEAVGLLCSCARLQLTRRRRLAPPLQGHEGISSLPLLGSPRLHLLQQDAYQEGHIRRGNTVPRFTSLLTCMHCTIP